MDGPRMVTPRSQEHSADGSRATGEQKFARQTRRIQTPSGTRAGKIEEKNACSQAGAETTLRSDRKATEEDVQNMLGKIDSGDIANILQPQPTIAELEEAIMWSRGDAYLLGRRSLIGNAAIIYDIITAGRDGKSGH
jgi:hypothetical protein